MKLSRWIMLIAIATSLIALTACHSRKQQPDASAINDANAAYQDTQGSAHSAGIGQETSFGDRGQASRSSVQNVSKRVYYFDFDSNVVHANDKPAIFSNANYLVTHPGAKVMLEGHTDPRGSREYNIGLGERRAKAVAELLTARGVNPNQIRIVSYGAEKLAAYGHTETDFQKDRRVVLVYLKR